MGLYFSQPGDDVDYTPAGALSAGDVVRMADGSVGVALRDVAAGVTTSLRKSGIFRGDAESADTWSAGDILAYDQSAGKLVKASLTLDGAGDKIIGPATRAKTNGQTEGYARLNGQPRNHGLQLQSITYEFDCENGKDTDEHVLIPAEQNPHGLLLLGAYGIVTEVFAGSSQDQGIVTIEDEDDGAICTLTPTDGAADVIGDVIVGTADVFSATTGDAAKFVPAGKAVQGFVSQVTAGGSPAGKIKVYLLFMPLL